MPYSLMSQCGILIHSIVTYAEAVIKSFLIEWSYLTYVHQFCGAYGGCRIKV